MSSDVADRPADPSTEDAASETDLDDDPAVLKARIQLLNEENERLRHEYARARQVQYRRTAMGLLIVGAIATIAALLFPAERTVLLALGGTGVFAGVLTYYLTPEQVVPASVGERIYSAVADNQSRITAGLGVQDDRVFVPFETDGRTTARLFIPQHTTYELPDNDDLEGPFVVTPNEQQRGIALTPAGDPLVEELQGIVTGDLATQPALLANQVADAIVESFELADTISTEVTDGQLTASVSGSTYGDLTRFDHPIASLFATTLAIQLSTAVECSTQPADDDRADFLITCHWDTEQPTTPE